MTGFRIDTSRFKQRLSRLGSDFAAVSFRPDIEKFTAKTLQTAIKLTPVRSVSLITKNQIAQFHDRSRYIRKNPDSATRTITEDKFVAERAQARFLYRKSWKQCADSAKVRVTVSQQVAQSVTRRRKPVQQPPKGYAQWRGGGRTLSLVIFNPFLEQKSNYKKWSGKDVLKKAASQNQAQFNRDIENRIRRATYAASKL